MQYKIVNQNNQPLEFANVYASDTAGIPTNTWDAQTDSAGMVEIPSYIGSTQITISYQTHKTVFVFIALVNPIVINIPENMLNTFTVDADAPKNTNTFDWNQVLTILLIISTATTLILGLSQLIKYLRKKKKAHA